MLDGFATLVEQIALAGKRRWPEPAAAPERFDDTLAVLRLDHADTTADQVLPALAEIFGLLPVDLDLLTAASSVEFDPNFGLAFGLLQGSPGPSRVSVALAFELCGAPLMSAPARARLGPLAPLRRDRLLDLLGEEPMPRRVLRVPDRVVAHLLGDDSWDPMIAAMRLDTSAFDVRTDAADAGSPGQPGTVPADQTLSSRAATLATAIERGEPLSWVHARAGTAGISLAVQAFRSLSISCVTVDLRRCPAEVLLDDAVRLAAREAALRRCGLVVAGAELLADAATSWILRLMLDAAVPVVAVADAGWQAGWLDYLPVTVSAPPASGPIRDALWRANVPSAPVGDPRWPDLVGLRLTPEQIAQAGRHLARFSDPAKPAPLTTLLETARRIGSSRSATRSAKPSATFDDLVLPESTLDSIRQLVSWARRRDAVIAANPRLVSGGKGRGVSALFAGASGTGKTLTAHVVADALNLDLYQVELPTVVDKYIGETEKNLQRVFQEAENLNAVLFFDEADSLFGARSEVRDSRDRYANIEVAYLLQRMEQFDGIAILATNLRGNLDVAFSRRLQFIVHFPEPDAPTRTQLWRRHLAGFEPLDGADPVDTEHLGRTVELAGGDIRNVVMAAAFAAADDESPVGMRHVVTAVERELRKLGRRVPAQGIGLPYS